jgi:hypothetical protein
VQGKLRRPLALVHLQLERLFRLQESRFAAGRPGRQDQQERHREGGEGGAGMPAEFEGHVDRVFEWVAQYRGRRLTLR